MHGDSGREGVGRFPGLFLSLHPFRPLRLELPLSNRKKKTGKFLPQRSKERGDGTESIAPDLDYSSMLSLIYPYKKAKNQKSLLLCYTEIFTPFNRKLDPSDIYNSAVFVDSHFP